MLTLSASNLRGWVILDFEVMTREALLHWGDSFSHGRTALFAEKIGFWIVAILRRLEMQHMNGYDDYFIRKIISSSTKADTPEELTHLQLRAKAIIKPNTLNSIKQTIVVKFKLLELAHWWTIFENHTLPFLPPQKLMLFCHSSCLCVRHWPVRLNSDGCVCFYSKFNQELSRQNDRHSTKIHLHRGKHRQRKINGP